MTSFWVCQSLAFVFYFLYGSFFEWWFHKHLFHSPKFIKATFNAHTVVHHQRYKYEKKSYEWQEGQEKDHITMDWFAPILFVGVHLPIQIAIQYITGIPSVIGGSAAISGVLCGLRVFPLLYARSERTDIRANPRVPVRQRASPDSP